VLAGCASNSDTAPENNDAGTIAVEDSVNNDSTETNSEISNRKIIYTATADITTDNLIETILLIKNNVNNDEWFDKESVSNGTAYFTVRVKSERIDAFMASIAKECTITNYNKTATDISMTYQDTENRIASLEAETARLNVLYESASISEMITINKRLSEINLQLGSLNGTLNRYDSQIEYSEVTLTIREEATPAAKLSFGQRLGNLFKNAWKALGTFLQWILFAIVAIFPFVIVIGPISVGIYFLVRFINKKKKKKLITGNDNNPNYNYQNYNNPNYNNPNYNNPNYNYKNYYKPNDNVPKNIVPNDDYTDNKVTDNEIKNDEVTDDNAIDNNVTDDTTNKE